MEKAVHVNDINQTICDTAHSHTNVQRTIKCKAGFKHRCGCRKGVCMCVPVYST